MWGWKTGQTLTGPWLHNFLMNDILRFSPIWRQSPAQKIQCKSSCPCGWELPGPTVSKNKYPRRAVQDQCQIVKQAWINVVELYSPNISISNPAHLSRLALHPSPITKPIVLSSIYAALCSVTSQPWNWIFDDGIRTMSFKHFSGNGFKHFPPKLWGYLAERATSICWGSDWDLAQIAGSFQRRQKESSGMPNVFSETGAVRQTRQVHLTSWFSWSRTVSSRNQVAQKLFPGLIEKASANCNINFSNNYSSAAKANAQRLPRKISKFFTLSLATTMNHGDFHFKPCPDLLLTSLPHVDHMLGQYSPADARDLMSVQWYNHGSVTVGRKHVLLVNNWPISSYISCIFGIVYDKCGWYCVMLLGLVQCILSTSHMEKNRELNQVWPLVEGCTFKGCEESRFSRLALNQPPRLEPSLLNPEWLPVGVCKMQPKKPEPPSHTQMSHHRALLLFGCSKTPQPLMRAIERSRVAALPHHRSHMLTAAADKLFQDRFGGNCRTNLPCPPSHRNGCSSPNPLGSSKSKNMKRSWQIQGQVQKIKFGKHHAWEVASPPVSCRKPLQPRMFAFNAQTISMPVAWWVGRR